MLVSAAAGGPTRLPGGGCASMGVGALCKTPALYKHSISLSGSCTASHERYSQNAGNVMATAAWLYARPGAEEWLGARRHICCRRDACGTLLLRRHPPLGTSAAVLVSIATRGCCSVPPGVAMTAGSGRGMGDNVASSMCTKSGTYPFSHRCTLRWLRRLYSRLKGTPYDPLMKRRGSLEKNRFPESGS